MASARFSTNRDFSIQAVGYANMLAQLDHVKSERDRLQKEFDELMKQPAIRKNVENGNLRTLELLQATINTAARDIKTYEELIHLHEQDIANCEAMSSEATEQRDGLSSNLKTMQMHPPVNSGWQARLTGEDPSGFRQSMADLQFHG